MLSKLMETPFMQFIEIQHLANSDFTYNDLFYRVQSKSENDLLKRKHKEEIILINTANFSNDFRANLTELLKKVESFNPKAVGVDITFDNREKDSATIELIQEIKSHKNIVCAYKKSALKGENLVFPTVINKGDVDFPPEQHSIRFYKGGEQTFAYQLFKAARGKNAQNEVKYAADFPIAYSSIGNGIVDFNEDFPYNDEKNYKVIEANKLLTGEDIKNHYGQSLSGSIVIIGHLGINDYDSEDKHAVPTDTDKLVNRNLLMPGAAIHANALSNLLDNHILHRPNSLLIEIIMNLVMLLMIILVLNHPLKIVLISGLAILSIVWIWLALYLMEFNIYIQVGVTLIELMILEEFVETFDPFVMLFWQRIRRRKEQKITTK
jgi:CHASE2 domain-containing sensor protein